MSQPQRKSVHFQTAIMLMFLSVISYISPLIAAARDLRGGTQESNISNQQGVYFLSRSEGDVKAPGRNPKTYLPPTSPSPARKLKNPTFATNKVSISYPEADGDIKAPGRNPTTYLPPTPPSAARVPAGKLKNPTFATGNVSISYPESKGDGRAPGRNPTTYLPPTPDVPSRH